MNADPAYRGIGAVVAASVIGWVAGRAGMSAMEVGLVVGLTGAGILMATGAKFWS